MTSPIRTFVKGTEDYLTVSVTDSTGAELGDALVVEFSIDGCATWLTAAWTGTAATTRSARYLFTAAATTALAVGYYTVYVRLGTDAIEVVGAIQVVAP